MTWLQRMLATALGPATLQKMLAFASGPTLVEQEQLSVFFPAAVRPRAVASILWRELVAVGEGIPPHTP